MRPRVRPIEFRSLSRKVAGLPGEVVDMGFNWDTAAPHSTVKVIGFAEVCRPWTAGGEQAGGIWTDNTYAYVAEGDQEPVLVYSSSLQPCPGGGWKHFVPERVGDLPEAAFWEGDIVETSDGRVLEIDEVRYERLLDGGRVRPPYSAYNGAYSEEFFESQLLLVDRGNLFRHVNGMEPQFENDREEALFAYSLKNWNPIQEKLGAVTEFTFGSALRALEDGTADMFVVIDGSDLGWPDRVTCVRLHDRDLAERCRPLFIEEIRTAMGEGNEARMTR